ncbi:MAG: matrixin family metalloprotease [Saprospiraceae bacterium]|nr:matrixin family metalloprotease [Saprospiraceae bacterium]
MKTLLYFMVTSIMFCSCDSSIKVIGIQAIGKTGLDEIDTVKIVLEKVYGREVIVLPPQTLPDFAFINIKSPRYRADSLLYFLRKSKPNEVDMVMGITDSDISITKKDADGNIKQPTSTYKDWGVMGLGFCPGTSSIVSTHRLGRSDKKRFIDRLKKIAVHEAGHNMGLQHCTSKECVMKDAAETILTIDEVRLELCDQCKRKLN